MAIRVRCFRGVSVEADAMTPRMFKKAGLFDSKTG